MNKPSLASPLKKARFILTRKNQKGQVAIFIALIFQVVFVFFALLINVGLLVHQKINLQQSTDLAAYYGAMKQAEVMNAISHVNFQIRQAWKLLAWRYRVLGTFGFQKDTGAAQDFPFESAAGGMTLSYRATTFDNASNETNLRCSSPADIAGIGIQDIPFFCIGHPGFKAIDQSESLCRINCGNLNDTPKDISALNLPGSSAVPYIGDVAAGVGTATATINSLLTDKCNNTGPMAATMLAQFFSAYQSELVLRSKTLEVLAQNLVLDADKMLDIEGNKIFIGSEKTFKNNLTEANLSGAPTFSTLNGLTQGSGCGFTNGDGNDEFLRKIKFQFINYYALSCTSAGPTATKFYKPLPIFDSDARLRPEFRGTLSAGLIGILESMNQEGRRHSIGFEKKPNCIEYYAAKATSEPSIPFLPMSKIKLSAISIAKPFGGSIGPSVGKNAESSWTGSYTPGDQSTKTDQTLPMLKIDEADAVSALKGSMYTQPNFSLFVGDTLGLRRSDYLAAYHSMLAKRDINGSSNPNPANKLGNVGTGAATWPDYPNWEKIADSEIPDVRQYDSLAKPEVSGRGIRDIEISAIAPNQFDLTYYSIDPDFYHNYYKKLYGGGLDKITDAVGATGFSKNQLRADFGAVGMDSDNVADNTEPLNTQTFSVKDQILLKNQVLDTSPSTAGAPSAKYSEILGYLASLQSSLLTGWTFLTYSDFNSFPGTDAGAVNNGRNSMLFGQCADTWNNSSAATSSRTSEENFKTPMNGDPTLPPTPGNCVTGGRTGYSVKIISPSVVRSGLINVIDESFFTF